jgi:hypothetical protein
MSNLSTLSQPDIESRIFTIRGQQVMIDRDLAEVYDVDTKVLNQSVKRNLERFPVLFRFQLTGEEKSKLVTDCDRSEKFFKHPRKFMFGLVVFLN